MATMGDARFILWRTPHEQPDALVLGRARGHPGGSTGDQTKRHPLTNILVLSVRATICGAGRFVSIAHFGWLNEEWLSIFPGCRDPLARHAGTGLCPAGCERVRGRLSGQGAG